MIGGTAACGSDMGTGARGGAALMAAGGRAEAGNKEETKGGRSRAFRRMQTGEPAPHPMLAMLKLLVNGRLIMRLAWARHNGCVRQDVAAGQSVAILLQTMGDMWPPGDAPGH
ncbi:hypothetical protein CF68_31275 [Cupriavidus sp. SK-4]|nr:hypothetical protein CF68_31275 [Cupriavidus sp. SK-4]